MALGTPSVDMPVLQVLPCAEEHTFEVPKKKIYEGKDVAHFFTSKAYSDIMTFLLQLNRAMFPSKIRPREDSPQVTHAWQRFDVPEKGPISGVQALLKDLERIIDEVPLDTGPRRFGNVSFRKWHQKVEEQAADLLKKWLQLPLEASTGVSSLDELIPYLLGSFGSAQRLDYGSGHELNFLAFLGCIWKLNGFADGELGKGDLSQHDQARAIVLGPMQDYFRLIRRLIKTYTLEPAGSHGVWGLDDHSFIPYILGSAQYGPAISDTDETPTEGSLEGAPDPGDVAKIAAVDRWRESSLYFGAIGFIHDVKTGPFWEHSPMLYDISGVKSGWGKINKGMIKMYNAEVLSKFPVVQHFPFGSLFSWDTDPNAPPAPVSIHASSQPFSLNNSIKSTSTEKVAPARAPPSEGTRAPWAASTTLSPATAHGFLRGASQVPTATSNEPLSHLRPQQTKVSWIPHPPPPPSGSSMGPHAPLPTSSAGADRRSDALNETNRTPTVQSMPPPATRAPWAKDI